MPDRQLNIDISEPFIKNIAEFDKFDVILNALPFGISVQSKDRYVLYENQKAKELTGSFKLNHCYNRWKHLPDEGTFVQPVLLQFQG